MAGRRRGELEIVLRDFEPEPRPLSLVYPKNRLGSARLLTFLDWMTKGLKSAMQTTSADLEPIRQSAHASR